MGQASKYLRKTDSGYSHWCPACEEIHPLPNGWSFNGDVDRPTFTPSFKHEGIVTIKDENGKWTGDWKLDSNGKGIPLVCHYILTDGILNFCADCTHDFKGRSVPLPELPTYYQDEK